MAARNSQTQNREIQPVTVESLCTHPLTYREKRVITLAMMDAVHGRVEGAAQGAFDRRRSRLIEGRHYYSMPLKEFREIWVF